MKPETWMPILVSIINPYLLAVFTAWKASKSLQVAKPELTQASAWKKELSDDKSLKWSAAMLFLVTLATLLFEVFYPAPLTRLSVLVISLLAGGLFFESILIFTVGQLFMVLKHIDNVYTLMERMLDSHSRLLSPPEEKGG